MRLLQDLAEEDKKESIAASVQKLTETIEKREYSYRSDAIAQSIRQLGASMLIGMIAGIVIGALLFLAFSATKVVQVMPAALPNILVMPVVAQSSAPYSISAARYSADAVAFESGAPDRFTKCVIGEHEAAVATHEISWIDKDGKRFTTEQLLAIEQSVPIAVIVEAGHDVREMSPPPHGNGILTERRLEKLEEMVASALKSARPDLVLIRLRRGPSGTDAANFCIDRVPSITVISQFAGGRT